RGKGRVYRRAGESLIKPAGDQPIAAFRDAWNRARVAAGLPGKRFHDLRRSAARHLDKVLRRSVAMKVGGWKSEKIYSRYAIGSDAELAEAGEQLGRYFAAIDGHSGGTLIKKHQIS
ncbi:MAG: hypothetical protein ACLQU2_12410, partial [Candidatus Binataceae bacterium]